MKQKDVLEGVPIFLTVAETQSFTKAARKLGITPSAASQAVRNLENRVGTRLLIRSTRSVRLSEAGSAFFDRAAPALASLVDATHELMGSSARSSGTLRLTMMRAAYDGIVARALLSFRAAYPGIQVEIEIEGQLVDIVERGFDAGLRYGRWVEKDMTALKVHPASSGILCAAPAYLSKRPAPQLPSGLLEHDAVVCRSRTTGLTAPWLLSSEEGSARIEPRTPTIAGNLDMQIDLTVRGHGISCNPAQCVGALIDGGQLVHVLTDWSVPLEPIYIFFPRQSARAVPLRAFVDHLRALS